MMGRVVLLAVLLALCVAVLSFAAPFMLTQAMDLDSLK